jgi:predicted RNase H-like HicB family nuclease
MMDYPIVIVPLSQDDGGGFLGFAPDLRGCMSDGETRAEALANTEAAIDDWLDAAKERGMEIPAPGSATRRAREEKDQLVSDLKQMAQGIDAIEGRLAEFEIRMREIEEKVEHVDAWGRFADLTGVGTQVRLVSTTVRRL